ncbi:hypothetical protein AGMMS49921_09340 [Endomicrobiia bacterium]|nr:hypothetical protein AGMMS49921_09340 [Endomicrobiia bacterium]
MDVDILASIGSSVDNVDGAFESSKGDGKCVSLAILEGDGALAAAAMIAARRAPVIGWSYRNLLGS